MKGEGLRKGAFSYAMVAALVLCMTFTLATLVWAATPTFTGDVTTDFTGPGVLTFVDPGGKDVLVPLHPVPGTSSGWDIQDVRVTYDPATDILYVGLNSYQTVGDADTDGNEGLMTYDAGLDVPNLGPGESVSVYFDLDQDGNWDVIAGVPDDADFFGFTVKSAIGSPPGMAFFGANLTTGYDHLGIRYWTPSSAPDLEFEIGNFSHLPNQDGELSAFTIGAFMGSVADVTITDDWLIGSNGPAAINIVKKTNGTDNSLPTGPYIAVGDPVTWTYNVTNAGSVNLTNIVVIDDNGTPGNLADDWSPTYISGDDGDTILETTEAWIYQAIGTAAAGQYANNATVTGDFDGFSVSDSHPDHYFGSGLCIHIEKNTNGQDADSPPGPYIPVGDPVTWVYNVTNCGSLNLTNIVVTDDNGTPGNLADDWSPAYISGDDGDSILETTEAWIYQAIGTAAPGQYANTAKVTGTPPVGPDVSDSDPSHYYNMVSPGTVSVETATGTGTACFTASNGTIEDLQAVTAPSPGPVGVKFPHGMFTFKITGLTPGQSVTFTAEFPDPIPTHFVWWKYHDNTWSRLPIDRTTDPRIITVTLTDGVYPGDEDSIAGQITDQGGPGSSGSVGWDTYPIDRTRVLRPWIALVATIIAGASLLVLRRRGRGQEDTRGCL